MPDSFYSQVDSIQVDCLRIQRFGSIRTTRFGSSMEKHLSSSGRRMKRLAEWPNSCVILAGLAMGEGLWRAGIKWWKNERLWKTPTELIGLYLMTCCCQLFGAPGHVKAWPRHVGSRPHPQRGTSLWGTCLWWGCRQQPIANCLDVPSMQPSLCPDVVWMWEQLLLSSSTYSCSIDGSC